MCLRTGYDDGGFSGATMGRPALQRLLADIAAGRVDTIVVYKIDRLTRSLADFAKIVEILDARSASFVSVTQQFNTTTSMGRLTLNVLLSFAQFEREVIGERIRDKIAASKKKGMWMGGVPPLGYRVQDRKLVIIDSEAEIVRSIFRRYAELGSVRLLKAELEAQGIKSKSWTSAAGRVIGGKPFSRGALYLMLRNRIYRGEIVHKGQSHPGEHPPIIDQPLWDAVQAQLAGNTAARNSGTRTRQPSLLAGMLFDRRRQPDDAELCGQKGHALPLLCLAPADHQTSDEAIDRTAYPGRGDRAARDQPSPSMASRSRQHLPGDTASRSVGAAPADRARRGDRQELARVAGNTPACLPDHPDRPHRCRGRSDRYPFPPDTARSALLDVATPLPSASDDETQILSVPIRLRRSGREITMRIDGTDPFATAKPDARLVKLLIRARRFNATLLDSDGAPFAALAKREGVSPSYFTRLVRLSYLAPDITEAILDGRQPRDLTADKLLAHSRLPLGWHEQRTVLGFA